MKQGRKGLSLLVLLAIACLLVSSFGDEAPNNTDNGYLEDEEDVDVKEDGSSEQFKEQDADWLKKFIEYAHGTNYKVGQSIVGSAINGTTLEPILLDKIPKKYVFFFSNITTEAQFGEELTIDILELLEKQTKLLRTCSPSESDSCYIPTRGLKEGSIIVTKMTCDSCSYKIVTAWSDLEHLKPGQEFRYIFGQQTEQMFHIELEDQPFSEVRIILRAQLTHNYVELSKMFLKFGSDSNPSSTHYDVKSTSLWQDGEAIFMSWKEVKDRAMNLIVVGQKNTVYLIKLDIIENNYHDLYSHKSIDQYLDSNEVKVYNIHFNASFDEHLLRISTFLGRPEFKIYKDAELKHEYILSPLEHMMDSQFLFDKHMLQSNKIDSVYVQANAKGRDCTFSLKLNSRSQAKGVLLEDGVYEFIPLESSRPALFSLRSLIDEVNDFNKLANIDVHLMHFEGTASVKFYICTEEAMDLCEVTNNLQPLTYSKKSLVGRKEIFSLEVNVKEARQVSSVENEEYLVIMLNPEQTDGKELGETVVAVDVVNKDRTIFLRENKQHQEHIKGGEYRFFKFMNEDETVKEIKIHINIISGNIYYSAARQAMVGEDSNKVSDVKAVGQKITITDDITRPVFLQVVGLEPSVFTITVTLSHPSHVNRVSMLISNEEVPLRFQIGPKESEDVEIRSHQKDENISLTFKSTDIVEHCILNSKMECKQQHPVYNIHETLILKPRKNGDYVVRFTNPHHNKTIEVDTIFVSGTSNKCLERKMNHYYPFEEYTKGSCFGFHIQKDLSILVGLTVSHKRNDYTISMELCQTFIPVKAEEDFIKINEEQIKQACEWDKNKLLKIYVARHDKSITKGQKIGLSFLVQEAHASIELPKSMKYFVKGSADENPLSPLAFLHYKLINTDNTRVELHSLRGQIEIYAQIFSLSDLPGFMGKPKEDYKYTSIENRNFFESPYVEITKKNIADSQCTNCVLFVALFSHSTDNREVEAYVQFVQGHIRLQEGIPQAGYVPAGGSIYYSYYNNEANKSVRVGAADNNKDCVSVSVAKDYEYPEQSSSDVTSFEGQVFVEMEKGEYFIGFHGNADCSFDAFVKDFKTRLTQLTHGSLARISLQPNQIEYFVFHKTMDLTFKIVSIQRFGEVEIYINKTDISSVDKLTRGAPQEISFTEVGTKSIYSNIMEIDHSNHLYCSNCHYLIAVKALKHTLTSILVFDESVRVPLTVNKVFNDILTAVPHRTYGFYRERQCTVAVFNVYSGKLKVEYMFEDKYEEFIVLSGTDASRHQLLCDENSQMDKHPKPIKFIFTAQEPTTRYSVELVPTSVYATKPPTINSGHPNIFNVTDDASTCMSGFLRDSEEQIFVSTSQSDQHHIGRIRLYFKVDDKDFERFVRTDNRHILQIRFPKLEARFFGSQYKLCLYLEKDMEKGVETITAEKSEESSLEEKFILQVTVFQVDQVNTLLPNIFVEFTGKRRFVIHATQNFFLDLLSCQNKAKINYAISIGSDGVHRELEGAIQQLGSGHLAYLDTNDTTFIEVEGTDQMIKWIPIDYEKELGMGYFNFDIGDILYTFSFGHIDFEYEPLTSTSQKKDQKSQVIGARYTIILSSDVGACEEASHCQVRSEHVIHNTKAIIIRNETTIPRDKRKLTFSLNKVELTSELQNVTKNIFVTLVADLTILPPNAANMINSREHYRFIYSRMEIPMESLMPTALESASSSMSMVILATLLLVIAAFILTYLLTRKIIPTIMKFKNRNHLEEEDNRDPGIALPQSSERSPVTTTMNVVTTDEVMRPSSVSQPQ